LELELPDQKQELEIKKKINEKINNGEIDVGIRMLQEFISVNSCSADIYHGLGRYLRLAGRIEEAIDCYRECLKIYLDDAISSFALSALGVHSTPDKIPPSIIMAIFDDNAKLYDANLKSVGWSPSIILDTAKSLYDNKDVSLDILDIGCGTGLCGELFRPMAQRLDGIDMSPAMVAEAEKKNIYDSLSVGDVTEMTNKHSDLYDLIIGGDVMMYVGKLEELITNIFALIRVNGHFLFNVEQGKNSNFQLIEAGRYQHDGEYIKKCLTNAGFSIVTQQMAVLRHENNVPVQALIFAGQKI
jgi:predicted TPR repeat methyltransferase